MSAEIRKARVEDANELAEMRALLWPDAAVEEHLSEVEALLNGQPVGTMPSVTLVAEDGDGKVCGFIEAGLRSHADGCDTRQPVGFVEGWFVCEPHRGLGVGRALMRAAEDWARMHGCVEMASDALIDNEESLLAHGALGFEVVDRCVHFKKPL